jgi:5-methylcytosine-specific restriction endonuclease McrA
MPKRKTETDIKLTRRGFRNLNYDKRRWNDNARLLEKTDGHCGYCGIKITFREMSATIDHIEPISKGGLDEMSNMVASCLPCNREKANLTLEEYRKLKSAEIGSEVIFFFEQHVGKGNCFMCEGKIDEDDSCDCTPISQ